MKKILYSEIMNIQPFGFIDRIFNAIKLRDGSVINTTAIAFKKDYILFKEVNLHDYM